MRKITAVLIAIAGLFATTSNSAELQDLHTRKDNQIGLTLGAYNYHESLVSTNGVKFGLDMRATRELTDDIFIRGDLRFAAGTVDYTSKGTGSANGEPDWYIEARGLIGKDWMINNAALAAYIGVGYRYLFNDARGISSTGYAGYRRESNYFYLPIGMIHRHSLNNQASFASTLEFDHLLAGRQTTILSDVGLGYSDVTNNQRHGYGLKLSLMYEKNNWAIGPYAHYWEIGDSDIEPEIRNGTPTGWWLYEPKNNSVEYGLKASQKF